MRRLIKAYAKAHNAIENPITMTVLGILAPLNVWSILNHEAPRALAVNGLSLVTLVATYETEKRFKGWLMDIKALRLVGQGFYGSPQKLTSSLAPSVTAISLTGQGLYGSEGYLPSLQNDSERSERVIPIQNSQNLGQNLESRSQQPIEPETPSLPSEALSPEMPTGTAIEPLASFSNPSLSPYPSNSNVVKLPETHKPFEPLKVVEEPKSLSSYELYFMLEAKKGLAEGLSMSKILRERIKVPNSETRCFTGAYLNDGKRIWEDLGLPIPDRTPDGQRYKPSDRAKKQQVFILTDDSFSPSLVQSPKIPQKPKPETKTA